MTISNVRGMLCLLALSRFVTADAFGQEPPRTPRAVTLPPRDCVCIEGGGDLSQASRRQDEVLAMAMTLDLVAGPAPFLEFTWAAPGAPPLSAEVPFASWRACIAIANSGTTPPAPFALVSMGEVEAYQLDCPGSDDSCLDALTTWLGSEGRRPTGSPRFLSIVSVSPDGSVVLGRRLIVPAERAPQPPPE